VNELNDPSYLCYEVCTKLSVYVTKLKHGNSFSSSRTFTMKKEVLVRGETPKKEQRD
jgi:hypothetical protein